VENLFDLRDRIAFITGGAGLLGTEHAEAIAEMGGVPVLVDIDGEAAHVRASAISSAFHVDALAIRADITCREDIVAALSTTMSAFGRVDILINNAAHNPKVGTVPLGAEWSRFENFPLARWNQDLAVGLTGAFLCAQVLGAEMARRGRGVILNISSDLGLIAPDQRLYAVAGLPSDRQPVKPVSYSVVKTALIGLTRYLATYWADRGIRVNALCPGGVEDGQSAEFKERIGARIPMARMALKDEYKGAVLFLVSDASSYMTGATLVVDGGRTCW
jgi:NAD(P)-dependent dehydrogenase (short-subunit alcohol dehydrogenase family)